MKNGTCEACGGTMVIDHRCTPCCSSCGLCENTASARYTFFQASIKRYSGKIIPVLYRRLVTEGKRYDIKTRKYIMRRGINYFSTYTRKIVIPAFIRRFDLSTYHKERLAWVYFKARQQQEHEKRRALVFSAMLVILKELPRHESIDTFWEFLQDMNIKHSKRQILQGLAFILSLGVVKRRESLQQLQLLIDEADGKIRQITGGTRETGRLAIIIARRANLAGIPGIKAAPALVFIAARLLAKHARQQGRVTKSSFTSALGICYNSLQDSLRKVASANRWLVEDEEQVALLQELDGKRGD